MTSAAGKWIFGKVRSGITDVIMMEKNIIFFWFAFANQITVVVQVLKETAANKFGHDVRRLPSKHTM